MHDVYRQPAELPREVAPALAAVEAPRPEIVADARADEADALSFVREGPYDESALDGRMGRTEHAIALGAAFLGVLGALLVLMATR